MPCFSPRSGLWTDFSTWPGFTRGKVPRFDFALAANRHDGSRAQHGHPCAEDPGRGSGFDQVVSCSWEGASVEPSDPWGETSEARNLTEETRRRAYGMEPLHYVSNRTPPWEYFNIYCTLAYFMRPTILPGGGGLMPGGGGRAMFMTAGEVLGSRLK